MVPFAVELADGVNTAVYRLAVPLKLLSVPPDTVMFVPVNVVESSDNANEMFALAPIPKNALDDVILTDGASVLTDKVNVDVEPWFPTASTNSPPATVMFAGPVVFAFGVKIAEYEVPLPDKLLSVPFVTAGVLIVKYEIGLLREKEMFAV